ALLLWRMMKAGGLAIRRATRDRALALGGLVAALAVAGLVLVLTHHGRSTNARLLVWQSALAMIRDHPIFGVGPDNFLYYYFDPTNGIDRVHHIPSCLPDQSMLKHLPAKHYMNPLAWQEPCLSHPHNIVLDLWLTTGILGLVAFVAIVIIAGRYAWRTLRTLQANGSVTKAGEQVTLARAIQIGAVVIVAATLGHGLVDNSIFLPDLAVAFWLAIAIANNLRPSAKGR
ncbi:MAG: O-antigen ligase family protein, partial [Chloroflexota bacterium]|nr:O-antigen ligase family protein [Chloroflexota bacterium]